jgi:N-acetylglucosamine-6-phosphate deacetylase
VPTSGQSYPYVRQLRGALPLGETGILSFDKRIIGFAHQQRPTGDHILPGFIDLQVNGGYGIDVMSASADDLVRLSHSLAHEGTTAWLPTVITATLDRIEQADAVIAEAIAIQREIDCAADAGGKTLAGAAILGMHLEGPFISPNYLGAHPRLNQLPSGDALDCVLRLKTLKLITLAPELAGAPAAIAQLNARGIAVSIGHTAATYEQAAAAVEAGARMFTHLLNAMPPLHHRNPGAAGAALSLPLVNAAVIPDGVHVHPAMLRLAYLACGDRLILTSDRVALAGGDQPEGALFGGAVPRVAIAEGAARFPDGRLAGSIITMLDGVRKMEKCAGFGIIGASRSASHNPANILQLLDRGGLARRARADLVMLDDDLNLKAVFIGGREID